HFALTGRAGVGVLNVLDDEQRSGLIIQLLGYVGADLVAKLTTTGTDALGFSQRVVDPSAAEMRGELLAAMTLAFGPLVFFRGRWRWRRCGRGCISRRIQVGKQQRLVGIEAFGAGAITTAQQPIHAPTH